MPAAAFFLALASAVLHATWHTIAKKTKDRELLAAFGIAAALPIYLPLFLIRLPGAGLDRSAAAWVVASTLFEILYIVFLLMAYHEAPLAEIYPIARGTGPVLVTFVSIVGLGAAVSGPKVSSIAAILAGMALIALGGSRAAGELRHVSGYFYALAAGTGIGCYTLVDAYAVKRIDPICFEYLVFAGLSAFLIIREMVKHKAQRIAGFLRAHYGLVFVIGLVTFAGYAMALFSLKLVSLAALPLVAVIRESSVLFSLYLAHVILGERMTRTQRVGAAAVFGGLILAKL